MKQACIIGPFPPPMGGDAKALQTIIRSELFKEKVILHRVNLSDGSLRSSGNKVITFSKINTIFNAIDEISNFSNKIDIYYLTIAQSSFGAIRDLAILRTIYKTKSCNSQVIIHLHGGGFRNFYSNANVFLRRAIRKYFSKVDKAIVLSNSLISNFENIIPNDRIYVIENCVENSLLPNRMIIEEKIARICSKENYNIVFLSNMIYSKGYFDVLESAKIVCSKYSNLKFYFAGAFPNEKAKHAFDDYVKHNNLLRHVEYLGIVDGHEKSQLLLIGDIFVLPTYFPPEGQPISILEAMSFAMPIITTTQGGISDIVKENINGVYVEKKCPESISNAILYLVSNKCIFENIAIQNCADIEAKYLEENYIKSLLDLFINDF